MRFEIERRFLVRNDGWQAAATSSRRLRDGVVRQDHRGKIRVRTDGSSAWLTLKGRRCGFTRTEHEVEIAVDRAEEMIRDSCADRVVDKTRHCVPVGNAMWAFDTFLGRFEGLVWAEIELDREDKPFVRPDWLGREVSDDTRFRQSSLLAQPVDGGSTIPKVLAAQEEVSP